MTRPRLRLLCVLAVGGLIIAMAVPVGNAWIASGTDNATDDDVHAGHHVAGTVGIQEVKLGSVAAVRSFQQELSRAETPDERAEIVADHHRTGRTRLATLQRRRSRLVAARENKTLDQGIYRARLARIGANASAIHRLATALERAAEPLSDKRLQRAGVSRADLGQLRADAKAVAERSEIAYSAFDSEFYGDVATAIENYNAKVGTASPSRLERFLRGERVNLYVESGTETAVVSFRIDESGQMTAVRAGERGDATLHLRTDKVTVERLARTDVPLVRFRSAIANDAIQVKGVGLLNRIKWAGVDLLMGWLAPTIQRPNDRERRSSQVSKRIRQTSHFRLSSRNAGK